MGSGFVFGQTSFNMSDGLNRTISCGTTYYFYDSGGSGSDYSNYESMTATFTCSGTIQLTFTSFYTESSYDEISIYDGSTLIGTYSGSSIPGTVYATSGTMIIEWESDYSTVYSGWAATIVGCVSAPQIITGSPDCESAMAFCASNENSGYDMVVEEGSSDTYPSGMCHFFRNPTWWYLRISQDGPIEMRISSTAGDVDFGCWGPFANTTCSPNDLSDDGANGFYVFGDYDHPEQHSSNTSLSEAYHTVESPICEAGALASPSGNLVDFGGSGSDVEYLQIPNARAGQIYVVIIANYSNHEGTITFEQTNLNDAGAGRSDCTIVNNCEISSITVEDISACSGGAFSIAGNIYYDELPSDGTLTISDGTVSRVFTAPFPNPISYSLSGIPGDGVQHTVTAEFVSSTINCDRIFYYNAPQCEIDCPDATAAMTGYDEIIDGRYCFNVCYGSGVNMGGVQTGYTNPSWRWSVNPHGGLPPYVANTQDASYSPDAVQGYDVSLTVSEGQCSSVALGRIRVSEGLETSVDSYSLSEICVGDSRQISIGGTGSDIEVTPEPHTIETSLGRAETTFIPDGTNCSTMCYTSSVTFYDFNDGDVVTNTDAIKYIRLNAEHSFIGDMQIKITCPNGREAIILQDYYSSDPNSGMYNGNAIDAYTYTWPTSSTVYEWYIGPSSTTYYTDSGLYPTSQYSSTNRGATITSGGVTYYQVSFSTVEAARYFISHYLVNYYVNLNFYVYPVPDENNPSFYIIIYTPSSDPDTVYVLWLDRVTSTGDDIQPFPSREAAEDYVTNVYGLSSSSVTYTSVESGSFYRIFLGEPDFYDIHEANDMSASEICNGADPHNLPGIGYDYAWTSNSQYTTVGHIYDASNMRQPSTLYSNGTVDNTPEYTSLYHVLPSNVEAGTQMYEPFQSFSNLIGCPLNGTWTISVCDSWNYDNGYVFDWEIALSEDLLPSNWDYTVQLDNVDNDCGNIATVSGNNLVVAPQTALAGQQNCNIILTDNIGCHTNIPLTYSAVAPELSHVSGAETQTVCEGQPITDIVYTIGGVAESVQVVSGSLPAGVSLNVSGNTVTISGSPTTHDTYNFTIATVSRSGYICTEQTAEISIIVNEGNIVPVFTTPNPYCEGNTINALPTTSENGITGTWSPALSNRTATYTFTPDAGQCATITTMQVTVYPLPRLSGPSGSETFCMNVLVEQENGVVFTYGGSVNGAAVTGLPAGLRFDVNTTDSTVVIWGTPTEYGTFDYVVTTTGAVSPCENIDIHSTITVKQPATLVPDNASLTVCSGVDITTPLVFTYGGSATSAVASDLPAGLTQSLNTTEHTLTIGGTPDVPGTYTFTVSTDGAVSPCVDIEVHPEITINDSVILVCESESPNVAVCVELPWDGNLVYSFGGAATDIDLDRLIATLPEGMTASVSGSEVTISGMPTGEGGVYTYEVTTIGAETPCENKTLTGEITVSTNAVLTLTSGQGTDDQRICLPGTFADITYSFSGGATGIDQALLRSGLPAGLDIVVNATSVRIYGTPTETGSFEYVVTTTGEVPPCKPDTKIGHITISQKPELTMAGEANQNFCLGNAMTDLIFTYSGGATGAVVTNGTLPTGVTSEINSTAHTLTIHGTPESEGTFSFSVSTTGATEPCSEEVIPIEITVYGSPTVEIDASPMEICNGSTATLTSDPNTFATYQWSCLTSSDATHTVVSGMSGTANTFSITITPTVTPGSMGVVYRLQVTDASGCTATAQQTINVSEAVEATITPSANTHCDEPYNGSITVSGFTGGVAGSTYTVSVAGQTDQTTTGADVVFNALEAGTYRVVVTNSSTGDNCIVEEDITISDSPTQPTVSVSGSLSICDGTNTTLTAHGLNGSGSYNYVWSNNTLGEVLVTPNLHDATTYSVTATDENGCSATTEVTVVIGDTPEIDVTANTPICLEKDVILQAHVRNAGTGYTVVWSANPSDGAGLSTTNGDRVTATPTVEGTYVYTATLTANTCGNGEPFVISESSGYIVVNTLPDAGIVNNTGSSDITCNFTEIALTATGGVSYAWSNDVATADDIVRTPGTYSVTVTDANGCTATEQIVIGRDVTAPQVSITEPATTVLNCDVDEIELVATTSTDGATLSWETQTVNTPNEYSVTATGPNGCTSTASINITRDATAPTVSIAIPSTTTLTCANPNITLTASGTGTLTWSNGATGSTIIVDEAGPYTVTARADNGCEATDNITIDIDNTPPDVEINGENTLTCSLRSITLTASGAVSYVWEDLSAGPTFIVTSADSYSVTGRGENGCEATVSFTVGSDFSEPNVAIAEPVTRELTCEITSIVLNASSNTAGATLSWTTQTINAPGEYSVTATGTNGCTSTASIEITRDVNVPSVSINPPATTELNCDVEDIVLTATGTGDMTWSNGIDGATITVTTPNTYTVTLTSDNGCEATDQITITQDLSAPNVEIGNNSNTTVITCNVPSISVSLIDDSDADIYEWSGGENTSGTGNAFTSANTYYVTATAPNGCQSVDQITITEDREAPTVSITNNTGTDVLTCTDSIISVTAVGSARVVSYSWSGGLYTDQANNVLRTIGTYVVTATADNGCTATAQIIITETMDRPTVNILASEDPAVLTCANDEITLTATGSGTSYIWSGGQNPNSAANTVTQTGTYIVTAVGSNGCRNTATIVVTENLAPPSVTIRNESGFNEINCIATQVNVEASGTGVSYVWSDNHSGAENTLTAQGTYTVTAIGANGCTNSASVVVTEDFMPPRPTVTSSNSQYILDCANRELVLNASGAVSYSWTGNVSGPSLTVTAGGTYILTASGRNGCTAEVSIDVTEDFTVPDAYIDNLSGTDAISCNVTSIDVIAQGGVRFAWSNALWGGGAAQTITNPGNYMVTVTGRNGCTASTSITIRNDILPPTVNITSVSGSNELNCRTSQINVTASGNGVSYDWSGGINATGYNNTFVEAGTYTVTSTGYNGCTATTTFTVVENNTPPTITVSNGLGTTVIDCNNPQIPITLVGSQATYLWNDGFTTASRTFYTAGQYSVTATGTNGCTASATIGITENITPPTATIDNNTGTNELNCLVNSISLTANGGVSYLWSNGSTLPTITVYAENTYIVTVTGTNGCTNTASIPISQAPVFDASISYVGTISCYGGNTSATVSATGGNPAYSYAWSDGQTTPTANNLVAGSYTVTVRDAGGCSVTLPCVITQPLELVATVNVRDIYCGVSQGSLTATVIGGTQPYTYIWSNGINTVENSGLSVGQYGLTVTDANNCMASTNAMVAMQGSLSVNATITQPVSCNGYNDGAASAECLNAAQPLVYAWSTGNASPEIFNLFAGSYMVTVTDAWGCSGQAGVHIVSPPEMNIQTYIEAPKCHNTTDGRVVATAFGGVAPYSYTWNNAVTGSELADVGMGTYSLTISDAAGCSAVKHITLDAPDAIMLEVATQDVKCYGDRTGKIEISTEGGVEPYRYSIEGLVESSTSNVFSNINAGYYSVRVTDGNGCGEVKPVYVQQPEMLRVEAVTENPFCRNSRTGKIEIKVTGGVEPYIYYWNNGKSDVALMQNIPSGEYNVGVIDGNGCKSADVAVSLADVDVACLRIPNVFTPNSDGVNDTWEIQNIEMFPSAEVYVFNRWGQLLFTSKGYAEPWDGSYRGHFVPAGTYLYVIDLFNDDEPYKGTVTIVY